MFWGFCPVGLWRANSFYWPSKANRAKSVSFGKIEKASGNKVRQIITIHDGINKEEAQSIVKSIKSQKLKIQPSIQGDQIRVTGKKRDDLQLAINFLQTLELKIPISFINFRD